MRITSGKTFFLSYFFFSKEELEIDNITTLQLPEFTVYKLLLTKLVEVKRGTLTLPSKYYSFHSYESRISLLPLKSLQDILGSSHRGPRELLMFCSVIFTESFCDVCKVLSQTWISIMDVPHLLMGVRIQVIRVCKPSKQHLSWRPSQ